LQEKEMKVIHLFRLSKYKFSLLAPQESGFQLKEKRNKTKQNKTKQKPEQYCLLLLWRVFTHVSSSHANILEQKSVYIRKQLNSHRIGLVHQHCHQFIVLGQKYTWLL